ncbi:acyltransferase [Chryseosolibacter indicus]|uniref:Acyltransferase n=1 Tax=Chryseosolibacter indicus TaxID=2782351 RepID=A0ABS5VMB0_9BACT|nr:acyltransferase [Chryseosolibacter indicus]MBT1702588.1 acyltransferase [Chryseosolibacter indicus]
MSKFLTYIHNLRGLAIFFVVCVHARGGVVDWQSHKGALDVIATFFDSREGNGTVMFLFIGGFLFQYLTHTNFRFKKYIEQKFKYVILPYLIISVPLIAYRIIGNYNYPGITEDFNNQSILYKILYYLITGIHLAPFWFISAITLFYLSSPILHALDNKKAYNYIIPILFITCFFTYRSAHNANPFLSYLHYLPVYLLGMWVSFYREKVLAISKWLLYPLIIIYGAITLAEIRGWLPIPEKITFEDVIYDGVFMFNIFMLKAVLLCFIGLFILYQFRDKRMPLLEVLGEYSFGVFFVHSVFIFASRNVLEKIFGEFDFSLLTYSIYFAFVLFFSIALVYLIKRITGRYSRHLIGS